MKGKDSCRSVGLLVCLMLTAGAVEAGDSPNQSTVNHLVIISYYGESEFDVTPGQVWFAPGDTVTFHTDDPGTLGLRLDDGSFYVSANGDITFSAKQLAATRRVRCSMLLPDGTLLGWEATHDDRYGATTPPEGGRDRRAPQLQPPTITGIRAAESTLELSWTAVNGAESYLVMRATTSGGTYLNVGSTDQTSFRDTHDIKDGVTYYYVLVAANRSATSDRSKEAVVTAKGTSGGKK